MFVSWKSFSFHKMRYVICCLYLGWRTRWIWRCLGHRGGRGCWDWSLPLWNTSRRCYMSSPGNRGHNKDEKVCLCTHIYSVVSDCWHVEVALQPYETHLFPSCLFSLCGVLWGCQVSIRKSALNTTSAPSLQKLIQFSELNLFVRLHVVLSPGP